MPEVDKATLVDDIRSIMQARQQIEQADRLVQSATKSLAEIATRRMMIT